ncbi:MAG: hypothetical protein HXX81_03690, partial [Campylobacterales bacterium]|nr:hypothetical protein [Campylobacterales bacterium]
KKIDGKKIVFAIYQSNNFGNNKYIKDIFESEYKGFLKEYEIEFRIVTKSDLKDDVKINAIYLLDIDENAEFIIDYAQTKEILTFCYHEVDIKKGCLFTLEITNKPRPVLNIYSLKKSNISLEPAFLQFVKVFNE